MSQIIAVTGSSGFIGNAIAEYLNALGKNVVGLSRTDYIASYQTKVYTALSDTVELKSSLQGVDTIVHTAARVHVMNDAAVDALAEYRAVNVTGTLALAAAAAEVGVRRFIFLSTVKVNGESTIAGQRFHPDGIASVLDPYAQSKLEAEKQLLELSERTGMEVVIIRPPLVYGVNVKGNFQSMIRLVSKRLPFPLGLVNNKRSLVGLNNLVDFITACIDHPAAVGEVFLVSDGKDVSTAELLKALGRALKKPVLLLPIPTSCLALAAKLVGKEAYAQRVLASLQVDISKNKDVLGWQPPYTMADELKTCFGNRENDKAS